MQTPFERLAAVLDNASANYLSEQQRQQQLADQRQYAEERLDEGRTYDEGLTNKNRAYEQEAALFKAGYLSKPVGTNTPEEIAAAAALAAQHALAIRGDEDTARKDTADQRAHDAKKRGREEQGWALNPVKSQDRIDMEKMVDGGMIDFGKVASKMTDEELATAYAQTRADAIKRGDSGVRYATQIEQEILNMQAQAGTGPTAAELSAARAKNPPRSMSKEDREAAEQAAQQMAGDAALQRATFANVRLRELSNIREALIRTKQFPTKIPAALGDPSPKDPPPDPAPPPPPPAAALGLDEEVARGRITEEVDKAWPDIESDYTLASLGDDAIRERINKKVMRTQVSSAPLSPETSYFVDPSKAEIASRLLTLRDNQKAALGRLAKRRPQLEKYASNDEARMQLANAILGLTKTEEAIKKNAFESTAATLAQQ